MQTKSRARFCKCERILDLSIVSRRVCESVSVSDSVLILAQEAGKKEPAAQGNKLNCKCELEARGPNETSIQSRALFNSLILAFSFGLLAFC